MPSHTPAEAFPIGAFIQEELDERAWTPSNLAAALGIPIEAVNGLISEKHPLTPQTAQGLGAVFGTGAEYWLNLEKVKDGSS